MSAPAGPAAREPHSPGRKNPKALRPSRHAQRRRDEALERQQAAREDATARARTLALEATRGEAPSSQSAQVLTGSVAINCPFLARKIERTNSEESPDVLWHPQASSALPKGSRSTPKRSAALIMAATSASSASMRSG